MNKIGVECRSRVVWPTFTGHLIHLSQNRISVCFSPNVIHCHWQWIKLHQIKYTHRVDNFFISGFLYEWKAGKTIGITVNFSVLLFNGVIIARQEQGITLQSSCSDHRDAFPRMKD